jgi:hypothetical protein
MVTKPSFVKTVLIGAVVAALIAAYSIPVQAKGSFGGMGGGGGSLGGHHGTISSPSPPPTGTQPQAGTVVTHIKGGGNTFTNVKDNYDGKHGEKVTTVTVKGDNVTANTRTYDANGKQTGCYGAGC